MPETRHEAIAPAPSAEQSQYITPSASLPDEYWRQAAQAKVAARSADTSTVACWLLVVIGLVIPLFALGAGLWALWMSRDDSRYLIPAAVGFGIFAMPFLG